jgi:RNA polymerase sigma factor (sigma-70 family)
VTKPVLDPTVPATARDRETARLLVSGDPEGLRRLLTDHGGRIRSVLRRDFSRMLDMLEIDEAISQATVRVWRSNSHFDPERGSLGAWFFVVARNCARRLLESKLRQQAEPLSASLAANEGADGSTSGPHSGSGDATDVKATPTWEVDLYKCIDSLPPQQRAVMLLDLAAGGNAVGSEVARELGTSVNSVYVSRANGRRTARLAMEALGHRICGQIETPEAAEPPKPAAAKTGSSSTGTAKQGTAKPRAAKSRTSGQQGAGEQGA